MNTIHNQSDKFSNAADALFSNVLNNTVFSAIPTGQATIIASAYGVLRGLEYQGKAWEKENEHRKDI